MSSLNAPWLRLHTPQPVMCLREDAAAGQPRRLSTRSAGPGTLNASPHALLDPAPPTPWPGTPDTSPHALLDRAPPTPPHTLCWTGRPPRLFTHSAGPGTPDASPHALLDWAPPIPLHMLYWTRGKAKACLPCSVHVFHLTQTGFNNRS